MHISLLLSCKVSFIKTVVYLVKAMNKPLNEMKGIMFFSCVDSSLFWPHVDSEETADTSVT